ncbi:hypothetical protein C5S31_11250 [ANME-1 cluster archaeon GoMg2]|nr:hypothetical protein [ANME-1 cluster archaeon GoMg2]
MGRCAKCGAFIGNFCISYMRNICALCVEPGKLGAPYKKCPFCGFDVIPS